MLPTAGMKGTLRLFKACDTPLLPIRLALRYVNVTETPFLTVLDALLADFHACKKLLLLPPTPEINLQDTPLGGVPELIPLWATHGNSSNV